MRGQAVGLLGGTFNPIHFGHLQLAAAALAECRLDRVVFLPSAQPPHKNVTPLASFADRLAMVQLAINGQRHFFCSDIEKTLPGPSYTIATLRAVEGEVEKVRLFFLIGSDALMDLLSWREYDEILRRVSLIVARRRDTSGTGVNQFLQQLGYRQLDNTWHRPGGYQHIVVLRASIDSFSSTSIRERFADGSEPHGETPEPVLDYIREHHLYQEKRLLGDGLSSPSSTRR